VKGSAKIKHHLWKRFWKNHTVYGKDSAKNSIYDKDPAKIKNIYGKYFTKIKHYL